MMALGFPAAGGGQGAAAGGEFFLLRFSPPEKCVVFFFPPTTTSKAPAGRQAEVAFWKTIHVAGCAARPPILYFLSLAPEIKVNAHESPYQLGII
jgi:hypothetical protein